MHEALALILSTARKGKEKREEWREGGRNKGDLSKEERHRTMLPLQCSQGQLQGVGAPQATGPELSSILCCHG